jgi:hypothetical protein
MKWGTDVPRWWIPDFNMSHREQASEQLGPKLNAQPESLSSPAEPQASASTTHPAASNSAATSTSAASSSSAASSIPAAPSDIPESPALRGARSSAHGYGEQLAHRASVEACRRQLFTQQARWLQERRQAASSSSSRNDLFEQRERSRLNRIARRRLLQDSTRQLNRDLRRVQVLFAVLIVLAGLAAGGFPGLLVGAAAALLLLSLRLEF